MTAISAIEFPVCAYLFSGYLSTREDKVNFPPDQGSALFERYENLLTLGLSTLGITKEALKRRPEFNFDSGNAANLESGMGILRAARAMELRGFANVMLVDPETGKQGADLVGEKDRRRVCVEVKTTTKQSRGRAGFFLEAQLYEKAREFATKAATQLRITAATLDCEITILAYIVNWFDQTIYLSDSEYQDIVNKLEDHDGVRSLDGIDGVWFIMKMGNDHLFLNKNGKLIDSER